MLVTFGLTIIILVLVDQNAAVASVSAVGSATPGALSELVPSAQAFVTFTAMTRSIQLRITDRQVTSAYTDAGTSDLGTKHFDFIVAQ